MPYSFSGQTERVYLSEETVRIDDFQGWHIPVIIGKDKVLFIIAIFNIGTGEIMMLSRMVRSHSEILSSVRPDA